MTCMSLKHAMCLQRQYKLQPKEFIYCKGVLNLWFFQNLQLPFKTLLNFVFFRWFLIYESTFNNIGESGP